MSEGMTETTNPDKDLIQRAKDGDSEAIQSLYEGFYQAAGMAAVSILKNENESADVLQDVFTGFDEKLQTYSGNGSFEGWLRAVTINATFQHIRRKKDLQVLDPDEIARMKGSEDEQVRAQVYRRELDEAVSSAIEQLPEELRDTFCTAVMEGRTYADVAGIYGISVELVKVRVFRARGHLKQLLGAYLT